MSLLGGLRAEGFLNRFRPGVNLGLSTLGLSRTKRDAGEVAGLVVFADILIE